MEQVHQTKQRPTAPTQLAGKAIESEATAQLRTNLHTKTNKKTQRLGADSYV